MARTESRPPFLVYFLEGEVPPELNRIDPRSAQVSAILHGVNLDLPKGVKRDPVRFSPTLGVEKDMNRAACIVAVYVMTSIACAERISNPSFHAGANDWSYASPWGNFFYTDGPNTITSMGGWGNNLDSSNAYVFQDTGHTFAADTVYTLTAVWRNESTSNEPRADNIKLTLFETGGMIHLASTLDSSPDRDWNTTTVVFDTADDPSMVGQTMGVRFDLTFGTGTWVHIDSISLRDDSTPITSTTTINPHVT
ncbi:MAG: hypothetical protein ACI9QL_001420 [Candidatus Omnitrophota bacterium]